MPLSYPERGPGDRSWLNPFDPGAVDPRIAAFYERTASFRLQLWSRWSPLHRPLGELIDRIFARRLGQLRMAAEPDGSLELSSPPVRFGGPGFYFVVRDGPSAWAKPVPAMTERIRV